jgi:hypothetical protein
MFACQSFRLLRPRRPSWSAAALTLTLTLTVTAAAAGSPARAIENLQRDLGALEAMLEQIDPGIADGDAQAIGFNTDLGDGSPAFRRRSMATIAHAAARNLDQLISDYRAAGDGPHAGDAETLRLSMYGLTERIERLAEPAGGETITVVRDQSRALLKELVRELDLLAAEPGAEPPARPAPQPLP